MTDTSDESARYEYTPASLVMTGIPLPENGLLTGDRKIDFKRLPIRGVTTATISVEQASRVTNQLVGEYLRRVRRGKLVAVQELLDINPLFIRLPKVRAAWERLMGTARAKRRRGRPKGIYSIDPAIVLGLVMALRARRRLKNDHQAIRMLFRLGLMRYDQARHLYRAAKAEPRFMPLLLPRREERPMSEEEIERQLANAITPQAGQTLHYEMGDDGVLRLVEIKDGEVDADDKAD